MRQELLDQNTKALAWWRSLTISQKQFVHKMSKHKHYSFDMFSASTQAIKTAWLTAPNKEPQR